METGKKIGGYQETGCSLKLSMLGMSDFLGSRIASGLTT